MSLLLLMGAPQGAEKGKAVKIGRGPAAVTGDDSRRATEESVTKTWEGREEEEPGARKPQPIKIIFYSFSVE